MTKLDIMGVAEVAEYVGARRGTISVWIMRGKLPEPDARLASGPVWRRHRIVKWVDNRNSNRIFD